MALSFLRSSLQVDLAAAHQSQEEAAAYARRLHEIETKLLCRAFGGRAVLPSDYELLQRYLNGELSRAEVFREFYDAA
ncbi:hypothetical protein JAO73_15285 [Hymenobacter sp. BT523]|uniref:hypothetical protein n=1 Tax=Hymenobacter sp. BT523 TaxID=2795725 RepID=UPI0018ED7C47|nr:hypothetical protein [Hymenobacter sp. BT523]MBJ6110386.1 hypothetical protein [Hymenobacter sp. BT523]